MSQSSPDVVSSSTNLPQDVALLQAPPTAVLGILRRIGPGMILAGSIVGSGELIATTRTGAEAGFTLLWLIIVGCIIKVFVQIELGRYTIINAQTTLAALNTVPGPRFALPLGSTKARGNWITWFWLLMFLASIGQLGGIVGGVGQAMAISIPLTAQGRAYNESVEDTIAFKTKTAQLTHIHAYLKEAGNTSEKDKALIAKLEQDLATLIDKPHVKRARYEAELKELQARIAALLNSGKPVAPMLLAANKQTLSEANAREKQLKSNIDAIILPAKSLDDKIWAAILGVITSIVLVLGRYRFIEVVSIILVAMFTLVTIGNVLVLQTFGEWAVRGRDLAEGFSFKLPSTGDGGASLSGGNPLSTALAAFGIIGVGASELMAYPYWCIEKGYAKWTGKPDGSDGWLSRARGWLRVMKWDAFCSMVLYTIATIAFYLLGAAVLNRTGLHPSNDELIPTLTNMYEPVFGAYAPTLFLTGAFAVLYSTYFSASAANSLQAADIIDAFKIKPLTDHTRRQWVRFFSGFFPLACVVIYWVYPKPVTLVLISGVMQALLLPMLGVAALYFRYKRCDPRLQPGKVWDLFLWTSFVAFFIVGVYLAYVNVGKWFGW